MNIDLNDVAVFIKVVELGSFTAAAKNLGMPNSTVSAKVQTLEHSLGITLIQRTTRKLHITPLGQVFYKKSMSGLAEIYHAKEEITQSHQEPQGILKITAPVELGNILLPKIVSSFLEKHKKVKVELILSDRKVDLVGEGVDLAIRAGKLSDSSLKMKRLGVNYFVPVAGPQYLKKHGMPKNPKELSKHDSILFSLVKMDEWELSNGKSTALSPMSGRLIIDDLHMIHALTLANQGIALLPTFLCQQDIKKGNLIRLLPEWRANTREVNFIYPASRYTPARLSAFLEHALIPLQEGLKSFEL